MIIAGTRPPGFDAARAEQARRVAAAARVRQGVDADGAGGDGAAEETSAVGIAPRPPSD
jgi:hypothetical protein